MFKSILEIKAPHSQRDKNPPSFKSANDQPHYYAQMQIQMHCTKTKKCYFYQWAPNGDRLEIVYFDPAWITENLPKLKEFYDRYLHEREHPERHLSPKRREIDTLEARKLIDEYQQLSDAISLAEERKKEVLASIVSLAKEQDSLVCGHNLTKVERAGAIAYAQVVKKYLKDIDLEPYKSKPVVYWVLK